MTRTIMCSLLLACALLAWRCASSSSPLEAQMPFHSSPQPAYSSPSLSFSQDWQVIGPFQVGTREAVWGVDPLEQFGSISAISNDTSRLRSTLTPNASVVWTPVHASTPPTLAKQTAAAIDLRVNFSDVFWEPMTKPYGWAAVQWQAWARGNLTVTGSTVQRIALCTDGILEFMVDGQRHFGGDVYSYRNAPLILDLSEGDHTVEIRLLRDVRTNGGNDHAIDIRLRANSIPHELVIIPESVLVSDVVDGLLASQHVSFAVRNQADFALQYCGVRPANSGPAVDVRCDILVEDESHKSDILILPGQTKPLYLSLSLNQCGPEGKVKLQVCFDDHSDHESSRSYLDLEIKLTHRSVTEVYKVTHRHPSGIVSYAMVRQPSGRAVASNLRSTMPVLVLLHGAGVEASDAAHYFDDLPDLAAYVVIPTGVTPWSGDDWHTWGFADVEAAVHRLQVLKPTPDVHSWIIAGHSNGGQGVWYTVTHYPDRVIGAVPVSGYTSIQNYVPYSFWRAMDPHRKAVLDATAYNYRHELLIDNCDCVEIEQQHGESDDNVPPYHSRLMNVLVAQSTGHAPELTELGGNQSTHYFEGVMTTPRLSAFFERKCREYQHDDVTYPIKEADTQIDYTIVTSNPAESGAKGGIQILHLQDPQRPGILRVTIQKRNLVEKWMVETSNVVAFRLFASEPNTPRWWRRYTRASLTVNGVTLYLWAFGAQKHLDFAWNSREKIWQRVKQLGDHFARRIEHLGGINAILRTTGPFAIAYSGGSAAERIALQVSRNLYQYYKADSIVFNDTNSATNFDLAADRISLSMGTSVLRVNDMKGFPLSFKRLEDGMLELEINSEFEETPIKLRGGPNDKLGAIFLRPIRGALLNLTEDSLELVVWGSDADMLSWASRLVPTVTGVGQPDFVVFTEKMKWQGAGSAIMGFFDANWRISRSSATDARPDAGFKQSRTWT